jgi:3-oxoacyl-[acyl-carrier-protein] synthase I
LLNRCYFTGLGLHTTLGNTLARNLEALRLPLAPPATNVVRFADRVESLPYYLLANEVLDHIDQRYYRVIENTVRQALTQAQLSAKDIQSLGIFVGTSSADLCASEVLFKQQLAESADAIPLCCDTSMANAALFIAERFGIRGPDFTINTACTASANALAHADAMIRAGMIERALVVGIEFCNAVSALGFQGLQLITRDRMRPFDKRRNGLILGEACAAVVLDKTPRTANAFYLRGFANSCDTHSISAARVDGTTIANTLRLALQSAKLNANDITAIKVHGTASLSNDEAEAAGMKQMFNQLPAVCALKPRIGHTLGACGLAELALFCGAAEQSWLPGTPGIAGKEEGFAEELGIELNQSPKNVGHGNFMLNYFGFGGSNTSLIVSNTESHQ